jgi:hypothetical protein
VQRQVQWVFPAVVPLVFSFGGLLSFPQSGNIESQRYRSETF